MAYEHRNRCGDVYVLQASQTRTGKPRYYFGRKLTGILPVRLTCQTSWSGSWSTSEKRAFTSSFERLRNWRARPGSSTASSARDIPPRPTHGAAADSGSRMR